MTNPGIIAQYGFAFQKLVFIYQCLDKLEGLEMNAVYEADDDVVVDRDLSVLDNSLSRISTNKSLIQCKTGSIDKNCFSKVIKNWLSLINGEHQDFILFSEFSCAYSIKDFKAEIKEEIKGTIETMPRSNSTLYKLYKKYIKVNVFNEVLYDSDFNRITDNALMETKTIDDIRNECIDLLKTKHSYGEDVSKVTEFVFEERYEELKRKIFAEIDDRILKKQSYIISFSELVSKINNLISLINNNRFDINYSLFKRDNAGAIEKMFDKNIREVNFLKKIYYEDNDAICSYLFRELFYTSYREHYLEIKKEERINNIEDAAHDKYIISRSTIPELCDLFKWVCDNFTIDRYDDFTSELKDGCFVFLSGDDAPDEYFIDWNGENAK